MDLVPHALLNDAALLSTLSDEWLQKTGSVVAIVEAKNTRVAVGHLRFYSPGFALLSPSDSRMPRIKIPLAECPDDLCKNAHAYAHTLFFASIVDFGEQSTLATGALKRIIGRRGDVDAETEAILVENGVAYDEFDEAVIAELPALPWHIPDTEYATRRDMRHACVFTIDPATARDLDDALHCVRLSGGDGVDELYEVGVHIADVSYFVPEGGAVDKCASERTTSVYLVQKVVPMLPRVLCEHLCSLNPQVDRLTFSVIWRMRASGEVVGRPWFGRTIINSAVKLSYEHAQVYSSENTYFEI